METKTKIAKVPGTLTILLLSIIALVGKAQVGSSKGDLLKVPASKVDFDAFEKLTAEVKEYRKNRLVSLDDFLKMSKEKDVIILDARSEAMYKAKHVKGAINLCFSDFTQNSLDKLIRNPNTKILIYCNNNFDNDDIYFVTKVARPNPPRKDKELTLALNIPTFINLYGYGYKNVYELADFVSVFDQRIKFEGTSVLK